MQTKKTIISILIISLFVAYFAVTVFCREDNFNFNTKFNLKSIEKLSYPEIVKLFRNNLQVNIIGKSYLNYVAKPLYSPLQISNFSGDLFKNLYGNTHSESKSAEASSDLTKMLRTKILDYFNISSSEYVVVFTHSTTQGMKFILESFNFTEASTLQLICDEYSSLNGLSKIVDEKVKKVRLELVTLEEIKNKQANNLVFLDPFLNTELRPQDHAGKFAAVTHDISNTTFIAIDASNFLITRNLDLKPYKPDFVVFNIDSLVGFPSLGVILVKNEMIANNLLHKPYFGGGSLVYALPHAAVEKFRLFPSERFEDGSLPFLTIKAALSSLSLAEKINNERQQHILELSQKLSDKLSKLSNVKVFPSTGHVVFFDVYDRSNKKVNEKDFVNFAYLHDVVIGTFKGHLSASVGWLSIEEEIEKLIEVINLYNNSV